MDPCRRLLSRRVSRFFPAFLRCAALGRESGSGGPRQMARATRAVNPARKTVKTRTAVPFFPNPMFAARYYSVVLFYV